MPPYRAQNGWSPDAWNKIVFEFHKKHEYVTFNKIQIQEKERELKREYKILKEARKQSGVSWNEKRCMIIVEPTIWDNIITVSSICLPRFLFQFAAQNELVACFYCLKIIISVSFFMK
jgi:hypothetical protein